MACRGLCSRYEQRAPNHEGRYANGEKRCNYCSIFVKVEGNRCPCCGGKLKTKPIPGRLKKPQIVWRY